GAKGWMGDELRALQAAHRAMRSEAHWLAMKDRALFALDGPFGRLTAIRSRFERVLGAVDSDIATPETEQAWSESRREDEKVRDREWREAQLQYWEASRASEPVADDAELRALAGAIGQVVAGSRELVAADYREFWHTKADDD